MRPNHPSAHDPGRPSVGRRLVGLRLAAVLGATLVVGATPAAFAEEAVADQSAAAPVSGGPAGEHGHEDAEAAPTEEPGSDDASAPAPTGEDEPLGSPAGSEPVVATASPEPAPAPEGPAPAAAAPESANAESIAEAAHEAQDAQAAAAARVAETAPVHLSGQPDQPAANDDHYVMVQDTKLVVDDPGLIANDTHAGGATLSSLEPWVAGEWAIQYDWSFTYTPPPGFVGTRTYTYTVKSNGLVSAPATITIEVLPAGSEVDHPPVAVDDTYLFAPHTPLYIAAPGVLGNDVDADGDPLEVTLLTAPLEGTLALAGDGSFLYTPHETSGGLFYWFAYRICDGSHCGIGEVRLEATEEGQAPSGPSEPPAGGAPGAGNLPPTAATDAFEAVAGTTTVFPAPGVLANDTDPEGATITVTGVIPAIHGTIEGWAADGTVAFTPDPGFTGVTTFGYLVTDGVHSAHGTVDVTVAAPADECDPESRIGCPQEPGGCPEGGEPGTEIMSQLVGAVAVPAEPCEAPEEPSEPVEPLEPAQPAEPAVPARPASGTGPEPRDDRPATQARLAETGSDPRLAVAIASILGALGIVLRFARRRTA